MTGTAQLLDPERVQRADVIHQHDEQSPSADDIVSALVKTAVNSPAHGDPLHDVVEADIAERLMILSQNDEASAEVRAVALSGLQGIRKSLSAFSSVFDAGLSHEIDLFLRRFEALASLAVTGPDARCLLARARADTLS